MGKIMLNGKQYGVGGIEKAKDISYDNTQSGMSATNVQGALDELKSGLKPKGIVITFGAIGAYGLETQTVDVSANPAKLRHIVGWVVSDTTFLIPIQLFFSDTNIITCRVTNFTQNALGSGARITVYYV